MRKAKKKKNISIRKIYLLSFLVVLISAIFMFGYVFLIHKKSSVERSRVSIEEMISAVATSIRQAERDYQESIRGMLDGYRKRIAIIDFILSEESTEITQEQLIRLKEMMEVEEVSVFDRENMIFCSSDEKKVNTEWYQTQETAKTDRNMEKCQVFIKKEADGEIPTEFYMILTSDSDRYRGIRIVMDPQKCGFKTTQQLVEKVISECSTDSRTVITAADPESGKVFADTGDGTEAFVIKGYETEEEKKKLFESLVGGQEHFVRLNGKIYLAAMEEQEGILIVGYRSVEYLLQDLFENAVTSVILILLVCLLVIFLLYRIMNNYIFEDLIEMNQNIRRILSGEYDCRIREPRLKELKTPLESIQELKKGYVHKTTRMNMLLNSIGSNIAVFECINNGHANFYSDSLWRILEIEQEDQEKLSKNAEEFRKFMEQIENGKDGNNLVLYRNKTLEIYTYYISDEFIGAVIDRTEEKRKTRELQEQLQEEKKFGSTDQLTGVWNRTGFETMVKKQIREELNGTLLAFDLDNFKKINDSLGHPEGDRALILFSECLKNTFRRSDILGRLGGDEFAVFLPGRISEKILMIRLYKIFDEVEIALSSYQQMGVSVSVGAARLDPEKGTDSYHTLYESADTALYIAKRLGKNRYYINEQGIRCMADTCSYCRKECPRREILHLDKETEEK